MSNLIFHRITQSAAVAGALLAFSAFGADPLPSDSHDMARRLVQPILTAPAGVSREAQRGQDAHDQVATLILTGSVKRHQAAAVLAPVASLALVDPHQFAREHLRWTQSTN